MTDEQSKMESYGSVQNSNPMAVASIDEGTRGESFDLAAEEQETEIENGSDVENGEDRSLLTRDSNSSSGRAIMSLQVGASYKMDVTKEKRKNFREGLQRKYQSEYPMTTSTIKENEADSELHSSEPTMYGVMKFETPLMKGKRRSLLLEKPLSKRFLLDTSESVRDAPGLKVMDVLYDMVFGSYINIMLLFTPFAIASNYLNWSPTAIFVLNFLAMIPLASMLGDFTEEAAAHTNQTIGGLINASFGNAVEVVVAIQALLSGEYRVVQASMIGSIFSNLLLVLGCCFFFGGLLYDEQKYSQLIVTSNLSLLGLSCIALVLPTPFAEYYNNDDDEVLFISRAAAVFLILMYLQLLYFQLKTHAKYFEDEEEEETTLPFSVAVVGLLLLTLLIAMLSAFLVGSIDGFCEESGISKTFTGLIILPIVGNAVEHMTAVSVAMKNKMDLAMGVAVGSATQISLFVTPLIVLVGWAVDRPLTLNFPPFEICLFILSVFVVSIVVSNSKSNWLEGSMLIITYVMIAVGFWFEKVEDYKSTTMQ